MTHYDGEHVVKLIRALYSLEQLSETVTDLPIAKKDFVKAAHMALDSVEREFESDGHKMPKNIAEAVATEVGQESMKTCRLLSC